MSTTTLTTREKKKQERRAALAAAPAAWTRQAATRRATTIPLAGRDVDPRDLIASYVHCVAAQQLTAEQVTDILSLLGWRTPRERVLSLLGDAVDRLAFLVDLDAGNIEVRQESHLPAWYPENDHAVALRDVALADLARFTDLLARRDTLLRRGDVVLRDEAQTSGNDLDAATIGENLGGAAFVVHCPDDALAKHPVLGRFTALTPGQGLGTWRSWDTIDDLRAWARVYGVTVHGSLAEPQDHATLLLPASLDDLAPLTVGGLVADQ